MLEKLKFYDIQVSFIFNPLNWSFSIDQYGNKIVGFTFGPVKALVYYG